MAKITITLEEGENIEGLEGEVKEIESKGFIVLSLKDTPSKTNSFDVTHYNLNLPDLLKALWTGAPEPYKLELVEPYLPDPEKVRRDKEAIESPRVKPEIPIKR